MSLSRLKSSLECILNNSEVDLSTVDISLFFPRGKEIKTIFRSIQDRVIKRASEFEGDIKEFKEVGGYFLIFKEEKDLELRVLTETQGDKITYVARPPGGVFLYAASGCPLIRTFNLNWEKIKYLVGYHTHPLVHIPSEGDLGFFKANLSNIPNDIKYVEGIYCGDISPKFWWMQISKKKIEKKKI